MLSQALLCMALNIFFEARGESTVGMEAVAQVTLNRAEQLPNKVCEVVFEPKQFSWTNKYKKSDTPSKISKRIPQSSKSWLKAKAVARKALSGKMKNHIGSAKYFYNPKKCKPHWRKKVKVVARIDNHVFVVPFKQGK